MWQAAYFRCDKREKTIGAGEGVTLSSCYNVITVRMGTTSSMFYNTPFLNKSKSFALANCCSIRGIKQVGTWKESTLEQWWHHTTSYPYVIPIALFSKCFFFVCFFSAYITRFNHDFAWTVSTPVSFLTRLFFSMHFDRLKDFNDPNSASRFLKML